MMKYFTRYRRGIALFLLSTFISQTVHIPISYALTGGPSQPELQEFAPYSANEMVNLFTGDFSYNIPLFELPGPNGGYPFNISYQSGIGMDQEASWVGLGFSLNPGAITRQMRGLPDEFKGDKIITKMDIKPSVTIGMGAGAGIEIFGANVLNLGYSVNQNNYSGLGYSIDGDFGYSKATEMGKTSGIRLNFSLDSKEGVNASPNLSIANIMGAANYNSKSGLNSISLSSEHKKDIKSSDRNKISIKGKSSYSYTFNHPGYIPQVGIPMTNQNISAEFKVGGALVGIFGYPYITGFYNEQWLQNKNKRISHSAFGYLNYQYSEGAEDVLDLNREKDGMVSSETPNMGIPSQTYDIYSVDGQGMSAMYRPIRNDFGIVHDPEAKATTSGGSIGGDVAPKLAHVGVNRSIYQSKSHSGKWTNNNNLLNSAYFQHKSLNSGFEPWFFKVHGEQSVDKYDQLENIGGEEAVRIGLQANDKNKNVSATSSIENHEIKKNIHFNASVDRERKSRESVVQPITNEELLKGNQEVVSLFKVKYIDQNNAEVNFSRNQPGHHFAGFTTISQEGLRYNYAIPAYNLKQEEVVFSANRQQNPQGATVRVNKTGEGDPNYAYGHTDQYLKSTEIPAYAHSYLLTSIVGADYVDVTGDGVTDDDLGYWVKFTYKKESGQNNPYKWRDPYAQAHFIEGYITNPADDNGSFVYGEKEVWYLAKAETKTHVADFTLASRQDAKGAAHKLQDTNLQGRALQRLNEIRLYTKSAGSSNPIKRVKFEYDYSLCKGVPNGTANGGKLTLKKLWFEYGNSSRGRFNPYVFTYHDFNPDYDQNAIDRWGSFKPYSEGNVMRNHYFPYVNQDPSNKENLDRYVAAWSLQKIKLPSGGEIKIDYETDDYGYVQHLPAMQMETIIDPYVASTASKNNVFALRHDNLKVRFKLKHAIPGNLSKVEQENVVLKYLDRERDQVYFKAKVNLRSARETGFFEYITGYADADVHNRAGMGLEKDTSGSYVYGYFMLLPEDGYHPFAKRAWQHLRTNQPELATSGKPLRQTSNNAERVKQIKSLGSVGTQVRQMFEGFDNYCHKKGWGMQIKADEAWIRLNSPDKVKYGGGLRVRQISVSDDFDDESTYGQVYNYTIEEEGAVISSGVAAFEPFVGGDENPHSYAKKYVQAIRLRSDNNLFFEYPVNESNYPGAQVGYRQVSVTSLAAAGLAGKLVNGASFPEGEAVSYGTSGKTVHEFYTAKDFPFTTSETEKEDKAFRSAISIPFIGHISISRLTTTQGYGMVKNDMHGKQKKISNYRQDRNGDFDMAAPVSWVKYNYFVEEDIYQKKGIFKVNAVFTEDASGMLVPASGESLTNPVIKKYVLGQERDFVIDMREHEDNSWEGGAKVNLDISFFTASFTIWPSIGKSERLLRTAVTNKIIFNSGILKSIEAYDGGSKVITENLKWDKVTGNVLLTKVNNNFDAPVYSYNIPAHTQYPGMGPAYQNLGFTFSIYNVAPLEYPSNHFRFSGSMAESMLYPGDEMILFPENNGIKAPVAKVVYMGKENGAHVLYSDVVLPAPEYNCKIVRSGYRNQLQVSAGNITALKDPTVKGTEKTFSKTIVVPVEQ